MACPLTDTWEELMKWSRRSFLASGIAIAAAPAIADHGRIHLPGFPWVVNLPASTTSVALTFDDGPHPEHTPRLLDILGEHNVRATFYLIGRNVAAWPDVARRIVAEGHDVGNHSWSHPHLATRPFATVLSEIDRTTKVIEDITGRSPTTFRPPYGSFTVTQSRRLFAERGLATVLWSVDPHDWRRPGPEEVTRRILRHTRAGSIILTHDIHWGTVTAMPATIAGLEARGLSPDLLAPLLV
jgi:peptidoglycan/xylan/chitin deacetylase (PgdA/CDA1 family)